VKHRFKQYVYSPGNVDNDSYIQNEILGSFKITEYVMVEIGPLLHWNNDSGLFPSGMVRISSSNTGNFNIGISYIYDLITFEPEYYYFGQKYVMPTYDLPPGKEHNAGVISEFEINFNDSGSFYFRQFKIIIKGNYKRNNNFYNYYPLPENIYHAESIPVETWNVRGDALFGMTLLNNNLAFGIGYEFYKYVSDRNITYSPTHVASGLVKFESSSYELKWDNKLIGEVFYNPIVNSKLDITILGSLEFQYRVVKSFFAYLKINNLYNKKYYYRYGYPEPGFMFLAGLRIII